MHSLPHRLWACVGLGLAALALVAAASDSHAPNAVRRTALGQTDTHALLPRQRSRGGRFRGGGRGNPFRDEVDEAPQQTDGQLNPGDTDGQGQGTDSPDGIGQENVNATSGLPAEIIDTGDPQRNLFLDPSQVAVGLANDGQANPVAGQVASATSVNSFINNCLLRTDLPLTNGQQVTTGSCNPVPMGVIAAQDKAPSCKFTNPKNLDVIPPNQDFTITIAVNNLQTGNFVNAQQNYFSAPQATNDQGIIIGHSHVVIEQIDSLMSTTVTDPTQFAFFKGLNEPAVDGILSATVTGGLPEGVYKMSSIQSSSNHQPVLVGVAQHGSFDDAVYFVVSNDPNAVATALGLNGNNADADANDGGNGGDGAASADEAGNDTSEASEATDSAAPSSAEAGQQQQSQQDGDGADGGGDQAGDAGQGSGSGDRRRSRRDKGSRSRFRLEKRMAQLLAEADE